MTDPNQTPPAGYSHCAFEVAKGKKCMMKIQHDHYYCAAHEPDPGFETIVQLVLVKRKKG